MLKTFSIGDAKGGEHEWQFWLMSVKTGENRNRTWQKEEIVSKFWKKKYKKINLEKFEGLTLRKGGGYFQNTEMFAERPAKIRPRWRRRKKERGADFGETLEEKIEGEIY